MIELDVKKLTSCNSDWETNQYTLLKTVKEWETNFRKNKLYCINHNCNSRFVIYISEKTIRKKRIR